MKSSDRSPGMCRIRSDRNTKAPFEHRHQMEPLGEVATELAGQFARRAF